MDEQRNLRKKSLTMLIALVGLGIIIYNFFEYQEANESLNWPTATGRVFRSKVVRTDHDNDGVFEYKADIKYTFRAYHRTYTSSRVYFGSSFELNSPEYPTALVKKYPENSTPIVYYQRNNPNKAVLEPGVNQNVYSIFLTGLFMFIIGMGATIYITKAESEN